ncbi:AAA family ATPase [Photobacterium leiognathi]|uniref:AAA family ATPase n=1 Tax=Photobacterium leiognathi TaxID=553611 RepID=UPI0015E692E3|nr:AAA family ATPase [Photobacterium leiognathi]
MTYNVYSDVRNWLANKPDWFQEAADRLLRKDNLDQEDIDQIVDLFIITEGKRSDNPSLTFETLNKADDQAGILRLKGIYNIQGVERISHGTNFIIGDENLNVVYGHNGSGKSTYTRILKRASGVPRALPLKPNVFMPVPEVQQCTFEYELNNLPITVDWPVRSAPINDLAFLDIFDTDVATHYLTNDSSSSYTHQAVNFFEKMADVCKRVKNKLQSQCDTLVSVLPALPKQFMETQVGSRYNSIKAACTEQDIASLFIWTDKEIDELEQLTQRLATNDPAKLSLQMRGYSLETNKLIKLLEELQNAYSYTNVDKIRSLRKKAFDARKVATEAQQLTEAVLPNVGTPTWHAMWEAAKAYSLTVYPNHSYPKVDEKAHCVLCQQPLNEDAQNRLNSFEAFVQGELEQKAKSSEVMYQDVLNHLPSIPSLLQINTWLSAINLSDKKWADVLASALTECLSLKKSLIEHEKHSNAEAVTQIELVLVFLKQYENKLSCKANQYDQDASLFDRNEAFIKKTELEARCWVAEQRNAITKEYCRVKDIAQLNDFIKLINTRELSNKAGAVAEKVITEAFVYRFNKELESLNAGHLLVELCKSRVSEGKVLHKLRLKNAGKHPIETVLSEGERRIVALAAFIADVLDKPQNAPFIFDDPISSLDHEYEIAVANRLTELAKNRQVIVFTHRLSFYGSFEDSAKKLGDDWFKKNFKQLSIQAFNGNAGYPVDVECWNSNVGGALEILFKRLNKVEVLGAKQGIDFYNSIIQSICSEYRKLIERTVEDLLLSGIIKRHRQSVTTQNKLINLTVITKEDCLFLDNLMTKFSAFEHSQSQEKQVMLPTTDALREDINSLKEWISALKKKQKGAVK